MVTPFCPPAVWVSEYLRATASGEPREEACRTANRAARISGKGFARCLITTGGLTVPVEGGAGVLKRRDADPMLSEHGKWRREHLGAWQSAYGRTPYYAHLMPEIEAAYDGSVGLSLECFNLRLLDVALGWIDFGALKNADPELLTALRREREGKIRAELSIFDLLFRLGREAVFAL